MVQILDFNKSSITNTSQSISTPIPVLPSSYTLTEFGMATGQGGNVMLSAIIGVQTVTGNPNLLFTILRSGTPIFTIRASALNVNQYDAISFSHVDSNVSAGYFAYTLTVSIENTPGHTANLVGPVIFSGLSLV